MKKYQALYQYGDLRIWGNLVERDEEIFVEDLFIVDTVDEKVIYKKYNWFIRYNNPSYVNLIMIGEKLLKALQFIKYEVVGSNINKDFKVKKICNEVIHKGSFTMVDSYYYKELNKLKKQFDAKINKQQQIKHGKIVEKYIKIIENKGYQVLEDARGKLILSIDSIDMADNDNICRTIRKYPEVYDKYVIQEIETHTKTLELKQLKQVINIL